MKPTLDGFRQVRRAAGGGVWLVGSRLAKLGRWISEGTRMAKDKAAVSKHGYRRVYRMLCFLAWCDEELAPEERAVLEGFRTRFGLTDLEAAMLEAEGKQRIALQLGQRNAELKLLVDSMIDVALADGVLALDEQARLLKLGKALGLPDGEIVRLVSRQVKKRGIGLEIEDWSDEEDEEDEEDEKDEEDA